MEFSSTVAANNSTPRMNSMNGAQMVLKKNIDDCRPNASTMPVTAMVIDSRKPPNGVR